MNDPRGSIWRKWDLHVHTPFSVLNNQFEGTNVQGKWDNYINYIEQLRDISVIGLTDYFSIDGYKYIRDFKANNPERLKNIDLFLANVELRIIPVTDTNNPINLHIIFSPDIIDELEQIFFSNLVFTYLSEPFKGNREGLIGLGRKYKNDPGLDKDVAYREGIEQFKTNIDQLREIYNENSKLRDNSFIVVPNSNRDGNSGIQDSSLAATRGDIYHFANIIFSSNPNDRKYFLGQSVDSVKDIIGKYGSLKPCIHGSDAHQLDKICRPDLNRFCWIKADTTFEGLKQIIYEPEGRVKIQQDNPEESETYAKINKLNIDLPTDLKICDKESKDQTDFCISGKSELNFSNNLTCLIGGRGSGKSTLGHLLFSCLGKNKERLEEINSPLLSLELKPAPLKYLSETSKCDGPEQTEFFFQNEIEKTARNLKRMSELITSRLERLSAVNGQNLEELKKTWLNSKSEITKLVDAYDNIVSIAHEINTKENEVAILTKQTEVIQSDEYKEYQRGIKNISDQISNFESYKNEYQELFVKINDIVEYVDKLNWNSEQGLDFVKQFKTALTSNKQAIQDKFDVYQNTYQDKKLEDQLSTKKDELSIFLQTKGLSSENIQELTNANQKIAELRNTISTLQKKQEPYKRIYKNKADYVLAYKESFGKYKVRYAEVSKLLQTRLISLSLSNKNKVITFDLENDTDKLTCTIIALIKDILKEESTKENVIRRILFNGVNIEDYIENKQKIKEKVETEIGSEKHAQLLKELVNEDSFLEKMHLRMIDDFYDIENIRAQTKLGGKILRNTSFGERCAIVISIIIAAGTNPILIDQPEDNLDGRFITSSLVPLIRNQKCNRQIILITRDANIVIGGDAELINILDEKGSKTDVIPSTIENISNRQRYIWILDGGEVAFKKREQKYNID